MEVLKIRMQVVFKWVRGKAWEGTQISKTRLIYHSIIFLIALVVAIKYYPSEVSKVAIVVACFAVFFTGESVLFKKKQK